MAAQFFPPAQQLSLQLAWSARHDYAPGRVHFASAVTVPFAWFVRAGALRVNIENRSFVVTANQWLWHPPCAARRMEAACGGASWLSLGLSARCGATDWFAPAARQQFSPSGEQSQRGRTLLEWLCEARNPFERDGLARAFLGWMWRESGAPSRPQFPFWLQCALQTIESQPSVSVEQLAREAHFSPAQFRRLWQEWMGAAPRETLLQRRVQRAQSALQNQNDGLETIAANCGFGSVAALRRAFAARVGVSPLQWRLASREQI